MNSQQTERLYHHVKELAEKLGLTVREENFRAVGIAVQSGACVLRGDRLLLVDRQLPTAIKVQLMARILRGFPLEDHFVLPAVRELLNRE